MLSSTTTASGSAVFEVFSVFAIYSFDIFFFFSSHFTSSSPSVIIATAIVLISNVAAGRHGTKQQKQHQ